MSSYPPFWQLAHLSLRLSRPTSPSLRRPPPKHLLLARCLLADGAVHTRAPSANGAWVEYRDPRYGIGLAYPCWWVMYPIPAEGSGAALSLRSFDEDYFRANSVKGQWKDGVAPEGVYAADFLVFEGIDPAASNADAYTG